MEDLFKKVTKEKERRGDESEWCCASTPKESIG